MVVTIDIKNTNLSRVSIFSGGSTGGGGNRGKDGGLFDDRKTILALVFAIVEVIAFLWYALSYIPYARSMVKRCIGL
ncbi:hypothetical protein PSACC_03670 [Paramicrosporidium saccamoebae]|uniref:Uncharacterized protein n=1 Tax=Paramicrosporidium saccamoebae TaxID=1246581 RepID=A0A2H9TFX0_9FUNG|nr:hypothetical protein PSACC_03670 [Paramicrosporidium saccamoebae]